MIFDVGANLGQSACKFSYAFPDATIHSFEPVSAIYKQLETAVAKDAHLHCHHMALGSQAGSRTVYIASDPHMHSLIRPVETIGEEQVMVQTLDRFTAENNIECIDLLKVDTEGFDLEVLKGAEQLLSEKRVAFVLVEVGFHPGDTRHVLFDDVRAYLLGKGFAVFGIYDQQLEWSGEQRIRFANVCFSNEAAFRKATT
jgi:FkbM family methyltransferase